MIHFKGVFLRANYSLVFIPDAQTKLSYKFLESFVVKLIYNLFPM